MTGSVSIDHKKYLRILREYLSNFTKLVNINIVTTIYE